MNEIPKILRSYQCANKKSGPTKSDKATVPLAVEDPEPQQVVQLKLIYIYYTSLLYTLFWLVIYSILRSVVF